MTSKKELIIKSISEMNISMLEILLDEAKKYQSATKLVFTEKLKEVFEQFKKSNDTQLFAFAGICKSKECSQKGCTGLAFVGNVSNISMNLVFDETETDFNDIHNCSRFKINDKSIKPINHFRINIMGDEKANFNPTAERLKIFLESKIAYDEIIKTKTTILTKESLLKWIDKYHWVREELKNSIYFLPFIYRSIDNFRDLYNDLNNVAKCIPFEIQCFDAMADFQNVDTLNEAKLFNWLVANENLRYDLSKIHHPFENDGVIKMNYLRLRKQPKIKIDVEEFQNIFQFKSIFDHYYWKMHGKYKIYSDDEIRGLDADSDDYKNRFYLKYQLEKRQIKYKN